MDVYIPKNQAISEIKPNFKDAARRWEAYWNHDLIDRPILCAMLKKPGKTTFPPAGYSDRLRGDLDAVVKNELHNAACNDWLGDSIPIFRSSLGVHEIANYCGFEVDWGVHYNEPLADLLPIEVDKDGYWWNRAVALYAKVREILRGRLIPTAFDFHTNLDLLMSIIGAEQLCYEAAVDPETVDRAIAYDYDVFRELWELFVKESGCEESGYGFYVWFYSEKPTASLSCDFSALISREMFRRWGMPALEYESSLVGSRSVYHWDGPNALKHMDDLISLKNLHTFSYVPTPGTYHHEFLDIYAQCQRGGKCIAYTGSPDEIKAAHKVLNPSMTCYLANVNSREEFEELENWLINNT